MPFSYFLVRLKPGRDVFARLVKEAAALGDRLYGVFQPQLGFASNEVVIIASGGETGDLFGPMSDVVSVDMDPLAPTLRPINTASLYRPEWPKGGIYVHRWFTIETAGLDEFVALSGEAWASFEINFDAQIAGLFRAALSADDEAAGVVRLLLLTRYGSHGVWEASRSETADPEAWKRFLRRHALTRETVGRSALLVPRG
jgi:hypothetical protein